MYLSTIRYLASVGEIVINDGILAITAARGTAIAGNSANIAERRSY
jgi:hypothetical protein